MNGFKLRYVLVDRHLLPLELQDDPRLYHLSDRRELSVSINVDDYPKFSIQDAYLAADEEIPVPLTQPLLDVLYREIAIDLAGSLADEAMDLLDS